jgi:hypothetical protein
MAIQSAQSVTTRTFGGQLTSEGPALAARPPANRPIPETTTARIPSHQPPTPALSSLSLQPSSTTTEAIPPATTPQALARQHRHTYVITRATSLLAFPSAVTTFRSLVSQYQNSTISAPALLDAFFTLFPSSVSPSELGTLIKELADIYESETKRNDLLKAWNDWRAINEDYPALPGAPSASSSSGNPHSGGGARVLRLKNSTQQSSRSSVSRQGSWGTNGEAFPAIPAASRPSAVRTTASRVAVSPARHTTPSLPPADSFPALPAAKKPLSTALGSGFGAVRRDAGGAAKVQNAWSRGGSNAGSAAASDAEGGGVGSGAEGGNGGGASGGKKKGGKNKKGQMLYQWG